MNSSIGMLFRVKGLGIRRRNGALYYAALVLLASLTVTLLALVSLTVYLASSKAFGQASIPISSIAGAGAAVLVGYYFGQVQKQRTDAQIDQLRANEKEFYQRLDKRIKSTITRAP